MATPSVRPSTMTPEPKHQSPHIIPSDEDSIFSQSPLHSSIEIDCLPQSSTEVATTDIINSIIHKNSIKPLYICTLNIVHRDANNLPHIHPSSTLAPCENQTQFKSLDIQRIFGCSQFRNQKHLTAATNESLLNSGLLPSNIGSFATIANTPQRKSHQEVTPVPRQIPYGHSIL